MKRDPLRLLAQARPADLDPREPVAEWTRSAELARAMAAGPGTGTRARRARRRPVRLGLGAGLVGVAAAAAVALTVLPGGTPAGPPAGGSATTAVAVLDAESVLLAAAHGAQTRDETTGDYWHRTVVSRSRAQAGTADASYTVVTSVREETWTPAIPGVRRWTRHEYLGTVPATPADAEVWRAQGSPGTFTLRHFARDGGPKLGGIEGAPRPPETEGTELLDGDEVFWLGRNVSMKDLRALPADPARLRASLLRWYDGGDTESSGVPMERDAWLFRVVSGMITEMPLRPKVLSAAFTVLSGLEGVRSLGEVADPEGRPAVAVAAKEETPNGDLEHRIYLDRARGEALASEVVVLRPAGVNAGLPAGGPLASTTVVSTEWTSTVPG